MVAELYDMLGDISWGGVTPGIISFCVAVLGSGFGRYVSKGGVLLLRPLPIEPDAALNLLPLLQHMVGLTPSSPGFATVQIKPQLELDHGPRSLKGVYSSASGVISSEWKIVSGTEGTVSLAVTLPVGVVAAEIVVPKPFVTMPTPPTPARQICGTASETGTQALTLICETDHDGSVIDKVVWAAWGTPEVSGACADWAINATCNDNTTGVDSPMEIVRANCTGKPSCTLVFGGGGHSTLGDPCPEVVKTLAARVHCTAGKAGSVSKQVGSAIVMEGGHKVWDGKKVVGSVAGVVSVRDMVGGVAFSVLGNSAWEFVSSKMLR
eukprot:COSAG01_NODE_2570_length_7441_cov_2.829202_5_plen_323_part_00